MTSINDLSEARGGCAVMGDDSRVGCAARGVRTALFSGWNRHLSSKIGIKKQSFPDVVV